MVKHPNSPNNERASTGQEMQMGSNELTEMAGQKPMRPKMKLTHEQKATHAENAELKELVSQRRQVQEEFKAATDPAVKKELAAEAEELNKEIRAAKMEHQMEKPEKMGHFDGKFDGHEDPDIYSAADAVAATHKKLDAKSVLLGIAIGVTAYWAVKKFHLLGKA